MINYLKNNKYLLFLVFILSSIVSAQNNLDPNISWFSDPSNISDSTDYDHNTQTILITNYVGGYPLNLPTYFSQSEYQEYLFNQNFYNYWRERIELSNSNPSFNLSSIM